MTSYHEFVVGDRVEVVKQPAKYRKVSVGMTGIVTSVYGPSSIRVCLDNMHNASSQYGDYYFEHKELKRINELNNEGSNNDMSNTTVMTGNFRVAEMQFIDGNNTNRKYLYACYDAGIEPSDICVVKTLNHGFGIAKVVGFISTDETIRREIVCKVDFTEYDKRVATRKRMNSLIKEMNARAADLQQMAVYKLLAKEDDSMKALLEEFEQLANN